MMNYKKERDIMRTTTKFSREPLKNSFKPLPFIPKRDKKQSIVLLTPPICWKDLSPEDALVQYRYCSNVLWTMEKDGELTKDHLFPKFFILLKSVGYTDKQIGKIKSLKDWEISYNLLAVGYLIYVGCNIESVAKYFFKQITTILSKEREQQEITSFLAIGKHAKESKVVSSLIGEIQGLEDEMFSSKVDFSSFIASKNINPDIAFRVTAFFKLRLEEVLHIVQKTCPQLNEAYSKYTDKQKMFMLTWYMDLIKALDAVSKKPERKPIVRKSKPKSPDKIVKHLKYCKNDPELGISSDLPHKLVGCTVAWVYNTKYRKLMVYHAESGSKMSVKGQSLVGFDFKTSIAKSVRKPKELFAAFFSGGKAHMQQLFNNINTKDSPVSGRISEDVVILKIY